MKLDALKSTGAERLQAVLVLAPIEGALNCAAPTVEVEHLRQVIEMWEGCREMAKGDSDFDPIWNEPAFEELVGG